MEKVALGGEPLGITFSNGICVCEDVYSETQGGIIGLTTSNKLFLGNISAKQALYFDIRDSVSFGPYLIMNGVSATITGNGGEGRAPRTAIGQRKDGIMLFLVLDGDRTLGQGATIADVLEIMEKYGAHNASCLDGGTSTGMTIGNKFINNPTTISGAHKSRPIPTAFIFK
jgi:exopolysaccharide biosynthesis protein